MPPTNLSSHDRTANFYRYATLLAFGLATIAAPLFELAKGRYPGYGEDGPRTVRDVLEGGFARRIDQSIDDHSAIAETFGPRYRQMLVELFRVGNRTVHFGHDDWLFLSSTIEDYPTQDSAERLPSLIDSIAKTVREFEHNGCRVVLLLVPDKSVVAPEKVALRLDAPAAAYELALEALRGAGLLVVDPRGVLREGDTIHYGRADTHWTPQGALRSAQAVARQLQAVFPNGELPGEPYRPRLDTGVAREAESDLQKILGLPKESSTWARYLATWRYIAPRDPDTNAIVDDSSPRDIVNGGTSFSHGANFAGLLSATIGRRVQNLADSGKPISYPGVVLLEEITAGKRTWPKLLVWEIPDRLLYLNPDQSRVPLDHARALLDFDVHGGKRLQVADVSGYVEEARDAVHATYARTAIRCYLEYRIDPPVPADGSFAFACAVAGTPASRCTLQFDTGDGFVHNRTTLLMGADHDYHVVFPLVAEGGAMVRGIRFQPAITSGSVTIQDPVLASRRR